MVSIRGYPEYDCRFNVHIVNSSIVDSPTCVYVAACNHTLYGKIAIWLKPN